MDREEIPSNLGKRAYEGNQKESSSKKRQKMDDRAFAAIEVKEEGLFEEEEEFIGFN